MQEIDPFYVKKEFVDTYAFDLGYHMSYGLVVSAIGILFAIIVPYIAMLCIPFYLFKYYVDKYNLSFVYNSEFQGQGAIKKWVIPLTLLILVLFQFITVGLFSTKITQKNSILGGICLIFLEIFCIVLAKFMISREIRNRYRKNRASYYSENEFEHPKAPVSPKSADQNAKLI